MLSVWISASFDTVRTPTRIALGNFDGIHLGHQWVMRPILHSVATGVPTVVTFHPHPQAFFTGQQRELLTPLSEKAVVLSDLGIEQLVLLPFDQVLATLTPQEFVEDILLTKLQAQEISVGQDFRFGRSRSGTVADLEAIATARGITVHIASLYTHGHERVSSSAIREALTQGDLERVTCLLGRTYTLMGEVVQGQQLGHRLGFPTANLSLPPEKFIPRHGVYVVRVHNALWGDDTQPGVMNIGVRPTVDGAKLSAEVHLLDWVGNLYGQTLTVSLDQFLRPEQKFASLDALKSQIQADCEKARSLSALSRLA
ncbi:MAG TPA: bifunctional riboflavin kinase/FAD synthetase [Chroococcidiopsis sp.]